MKTTISEMTGVKIPEYEDDVLSGYNICLNTEVEIDVKALSNLLFLQGSHFGIDFYNEESEDKLAQLIAKALAEGKILKEAK